MTLTQVDTCGRTPPSQIWLNLDTVQYMEPYRYRATNPNVHDTPSTMQLGTRIVFMGSDIVVKETFEEIMTFIKAHRA